MPPKVGHTVLCLLWIGESTWITGTVVRIPRDTKDNPFYVVRLHTPTALTVARLSRELVSIPPLCTSEQLTALQSLLA